MIADLRAILLDDAGNELEPATDPFMLTKVPSIGKDVALTTGAGIAGMALALVGIPFAGPILAGGAIASQTMQADDSMSVSVRFARTSMFGKSIAINDHTVGSFFFPAIKPSNLKVGYLRGNARYWLVIGPANVELATESSESASSVAQPTTEHAKSTGNNTSAAAIISIAEAQRRLTVLGYDPGPSDGIHGPKTTMAIRRFQASAGLPMTGQLDSATASALSRK